jgi:polysaccharide pyruvyl transferase CsaB
MYRIGITGSYGGCNLGDEGILSALVAGLRAGTDVEITVFTGHPDDTLRRHRVENAIRSEGMSREELLPHITRLDLLIVGGGGILFDHWVRNHAREPLIAEEHRVPVMVCSVGSGPLRDPKAIEAARRLVDDAQIVTVRDSRSQRELEAVGVRHEVRVTADCALLLQPEPLPEGALERERLGGPGCVIGMSVREPGPAAPELDIEAYHAMLANAADYLVDRFDADVVFVPMEPDVQDLQQSHAVIAHMSRPQRARVLQGPYTSGQLLTLVGDFSFAVGMRLHFLVFAALNRVPFVALPYGSKVTGFVEDLGFESPPIRDITAGRLLAYLDRAWDRKDAVRATIERGLPPLQDRARENIRLALGLLERQPAHSVPTAR